MSQWRECGDMWLLNYIQPLTVNSFIVFCFNTQSSCFSFGIFCSINCITYSLHNLFCLFQGYSSYATSFLFSLGLLVLCSCSATFGFLLTSFLLILTSCFAIPLSLLKFFGRIRLVPSIFSLELVSLESFSVLCLLSSLTRIGFGSNVVVGIP